MKPPRVAIVSDFAEERWFSMDLVAEMLTLHIGRDHGNTVRVTRVCPKFIRVLSHVPVIGHRWTVTTAERLLNRFLNYPRWLRKHRADFDLFHVVDHSYSQLVHYLPAERAVVTCHDLDAFRCLLQPDVAPRSALARWVASRTLDGLRRAAKVSCDSRSTRDQLLSRAIVPSDRAVIVPLGIHPACSPAPDAPADEIAAWMLGSGEDQSIELLHVGSTIPRKRIDLLLHTFHSVRREFSKIRLVRVGGPFTDAQAELVRRLELGDDIVELPFLSPRVLAAVYRRAALILLTSDAEGFGLPVVEAMGCQTPVVATDLESLREVGGDAAIYCPGDDVDAWASTVIQMLRERAMKNGRWLERRAMCLRQAERFTWPRSAAKTVELYKQVVA